MAPLTSELSVVSITITWAIADGVMTSSWRIHHVVVELVELPIKTLLHAGAMPQQ
jgi:hypothetical protein